MSEISFEVKVIGKMRYLHILYKTGNNHINSFMTFYWQDEDIYTFQSKIGREDCILRYNVMTHNIESIINYNYKNNTVIFDSIIDQQLIRIIVSYDECKDKLYELLI